VPQGVYKISGVLITGGYGGNPVSGGTGGAGGRGGHLLWFNDLSVSPGETLTIVVSTFGSGGNVGTPTLGGQPGNTSIIRPNGTGITLFGTAVASLSGTLREYRKVESNAAQTATNQYGAGGGGAAGYSGIGSSSVFTANGGQGGRNGVVAQAGTFGGGGGGARGSSSSYPIGAGGGGTGFRGESTSGAGGVSAASGGSDTTRAGSGGSGGSPGVGVGSSGDGGWPGGGGGGGGPQANTSGNGYAGNYGVVRIMWGGGRSYPSTNTQDVIVPVDDINFNTVIFNDGSRAVAIQTDGKILVGGDFTIFNGVTQNRIIRLDANGTRDSGFNIGTGFDGQVNVIAQQSDGKILVGGLFFSYDGVSQNRIIRLNADGTRDTGFSSGAIGHVVDIALQSDGKILIGGNLLMYGGVTQNRITRLNADGTRDTGFNIGTGFDNLVQTIAQQSDGKILVGGVFTAYDGVTQNYIIRLNADGTRDTGFNIGTGINSFLEDIALQPDGKILIGGRFFTYDGVTQNRITRLNADGTRDTGFNIGTGFDNVVRSIALQSDGKILVGGDFTTYNGAAQNYIIRLNADGTRDTGFATTGTGFDNAVRAIAVQSDGRILVGGSFTSYNGTSQNYIARLTSSGLLT
jgi:uncharacterized delta-60 repeat protein